METHFQFSLKKFIIFPYPYLFFMPKNFSLINYENKLKGRNDRNIKMDNNNKRNNLKKGDISQNIKGKSI